MLKATVRLGMLCNAPRPVGGKVNWHTAAGGMPQHARRTPCPCRTEAVSQVLKSVVDESGNSREVRWQVISVIRGHIEGRRDPWEFRWAVSNSLLVHPLDPCISHATVRLLFPHQHLLPCNIAPVFWTGTSDVARWRSVGWRHRLSARA